MKTIIQETEPKTSVQNQDENHFSIDRAQKKVFISKMKTTFQKTVLKTSVQNQDELRPPTKTISKIGIHPS
ncbi:MULTISPECIES: hypothetical protein [Niallia]|uniref:hypothetical protein n=1 Tax=Niallia TaxID=2837506 RepID=UPI0013D5447D|nr:hypothetical protein [Niallia circulans]NRG26400.1 hypothetical protein [Niallia circulans]QJX62830.1 hypothetical protein HLK66_14995 [Niallia circulans]